MLTRSESLANLATAKAQAQTKFLPLGKGKSATVALKSGGSYSYSYADLAACLESVIPALSEVGLALFQPVRIEDGCAIATTLLVHGDSGEWISSDYAAPVVESRDARSVGSAATYARRYGLLAMLAIASTDEDDDGEGARGGAHEMAQAKTDPVCPICGVSAIIQGKAEYGGGWLCFKKRGGCGAKWPEGTTPTAGDPPELMPRQLPHPQGAGLGAAANRLLEALGGASAPLPVPQSSPGQPTGHSGSGAGEGAAPQGTGSTIETPDDGTAETADGPQTFTIGPGHHTTKGVTKEQMIRLFALGPQVNRKVGKRHDKDVLSQMFGLLTRDDLTRAQAERYIAALEETLAER